MTILTKMWMRSIINGIGYVVFLIKFFDIYLDGEGGFNHSVNNLVTQLKPGDDCFRSSPRTIVNYPECKKVNRTELIKLKPMIAGFNNGRLGNQVGRFDLQ